MKCHIRAFLLMGQSNMAGRGDSTQVEQIADSRILMFRDGVWLQAVEPLHSTMPGHDAVGLGMSFAAELLQARPGVQVGLIPCAVGGTPLSRWGPGGGLYATAVAAVRKVSRPAELASILWHQGESDAMNRDDASSYLERILRMISALRADLGKPDLPFVAGELGRFLGETEAYPYWRTINEALNGLENALPAVACVSSEMLTHRGDNLHFDAKSLREFGRRYARGYVKLTLEGLRQGRADVP